MAKAALEIRDNDFILTPGRYVGLDQTEDPDAEPAEQKIARLTAAGVKATGLHADTRADPQRFFSYRRATLAGEADDGDRPVPGGPGPPDDRVQVEHLVPAHRRPAAGGPGLQG